MAIRSPIAPVAALLFLVGCAAAPSPVRETVVLLPASHEGSGAVVVSVEEGGSPGSRPEAASPPAGVPPAAGGGASGVVTVTTPGGTVVLDEPYETAEVTAAGRASTRTMDASEASRRFGSVVASLPPRPVSRSLNFIEGTDRWTPESEPILNEVKALVTGWPAPQISVIGHTDRVGSDDRNDRLGLQRAEIVKRALVEIGITAAQIDVSSRGEREPLVPTEDDVPEPRNRRVEINIR